MIYMYAYTQRVMPRTSLDFWRGRGRINVYTYFFWLYLCLKKTKIALPGPADYPRLLRGGRSAAAARGVRGYNFGWGHAGLRGKCTRTRIADRQQGDCAGCAGSEGMCCRVLQCVVESCGVVRCGAVCCRVLPCVAVCCRVLQCVAVCCSVLQCVAVCCVAVCCSVSDIRHEQSGATPLFQTYVMNNLAPQFGAVVSDICHEQFCAIVPDICHEQFGAVVSDICHELIRRLRWTDDEYP